MYFIINQSARAYQGMIPTDCYHQPYMTMDELEQEMKRIIFYGWEEDGELVGVAGLEPVGDVTLVRHTYVLPGWQRRGIGGRLLDYLQQMVSTSRLLVGTWADAGWAIAFYEEHGYRLVPDKDELLRRYWDISQRQIESSVVLGFNADEW
jgi:GNAT superfamily N-acetyltransferase